jgi:hypothetical protein
MNLTNTFKILITMFIVYKKFYFLKKKAKTIPITSVGNKSLLKQMSKNYNLSFYLSFYNWLEGRIRAKK